MTIMVLTGTAVAFADSKLPAPSDIKTSSDGSSVTISWDNVDGADAYRVWLYDWTAKKYDQVKFITGNSCKVTGLASSTEYTFVVTTYKKEDGKYVKQTDSSAFKVKTKAGSSAAATDDVFTAECRSESIKLTWKSVSGASAYRIWQYDAEEGKYVAVKFVTGTTCTVSDLEPSTSYKFIVTSYSLKDNKYTKIADSKSQSISTSDASASSSTGSNKTPRNIFYSPHTGSDTSGNGSKGSPFKTLEKAKEYAKTIKLGANEEIVYLEYMMSVDVYTQQGYGVSSSLGLGSINMIPFTGKCDSYYFKGDIQGIGCDTQKWGVKGSPAFSARYLLSGTDYKGQNCSIFIENNGDALDMCTPTVITDSNALADWQTSSLRTIVDVVGFGVIVNVYKIH